MSDDNGEGLAGCGCLVLIVLIAVGVANQDGCNSDMTQTQRMRQEQKYETRRDAEQVVDEDFEETSVYESVYEFSGERTVEP